MVRLNSLKVSSTDGTEFLIKVCPNGDFTGCSTVLSTPSNSPTTCYSISGQYYASRTVAVQFDCESGGLSSCDFEYAASVDCVSYSWQSDVQGTCSSSCSQSLNVYCKRGVDGATVSDLFCSGTKPASVRSCSDGACVSPWTGMYTVDTSASSVCDKSRCCCLSGKFSVQYSSTFSQATIKSYVDGQCGSNNGVVTSTSSMSDPTATQFSTTVLGQSFRLTRNPSTNSIDAQNLVDNRCSGKVDRVSTTVVAPERDSSNANSSPWTGMYTVDTSASSVCDKSRCCCLSGKFSVQYSSTFSQATIKSYVDGQCGSNNGVVTSTSSMSDPTATQFSTTVLGQSFRLTRNPSTNSIDAQNLVDNRCSGKVDRVSTTVLAPERDSSNANSSPWTGMYTVDTSASSVCSTTKSSCCCLNGKMAVSWSSASQRITVSSYVSCRSGIQTVAASMSDPSATSFSAIILGSLFQFTRDPSTNKVTAENKSYPQCSGVVKRQSAIVTDPQPEVTASSSSSSPAVMIGAAAGGVLVLAGVIVLIVKYRRRSAHAFKASESDAESSHPTGVQHDDIDMTVHTAAASSSAAELPARV
jgi:hypothetical protein